MSDDQTPEILDSAAPPRSRGRRVLMLVIAVSLVAVVALIAIPRLLDESSKDKPTAQPDAARKQLLAAIGRENAARIDTQQASGAPFFAFKETRKYPADLAAFDLAMKKYRVPLADGDAIAWYFSQGEEYIFCVEHQTDSKADAYAIYATTQGGVVDTDHGRGCKSPADFAAAAASAAELASKTG